MMKTNEELADVFKGIKETIDNAYHITERKYGLEQANAAMFLFLKHSVVQYFTDDEDARKNMDELLYRPKEHYQFLADYAISSFILNNMVCDMSLSDLAEYARDFEGKLDYSGDIPVKVMALAAANNNYWALNLVSVNRKLKTGLVNCLIQERYVEGKRDELDNTPRIRLIQFLDDDEKVFMSKTRLNNDVRNMNSDDDMPEYIPPTRREAFSKK